MDDHILAKQLLSCEPSKVVLIGAPVFRLSASLHELSSHAPVVAPAPQVVEYQSIDHLIDADDPASHDGVMCLHLPNDTDGPEKVLGLACRKSPELVLVEHSNSPHSSELLGDEQFFAFGFRRIGQTAQLSGLQQRWYAYRLRDYKQSPDWLNARFWAHPERYDL